MTVTSIRLSVLSMVAMILMSACAPGADLSAGFGTFAEEQALMKSKVDCVAEQFWTAGEWYCWLKEDKPTPELIAARQAGNQDGLNRVLEDAKNSPWSVRLEIKFEGDRNAASFGKVELIRYTVSRRYAGSRAENSNSLELLIQGSDPFNNAREYFSGRFITERLADDSQGIGVLGQSNQFVNGPYLIEARSGGYSWSVAAKLSPTATN